MGFVSSFVRHFARRTHKSNLLREFNVDSSLFAVEIQPDTSWVGDNEKVMIGNVAQAVFREDGLRGVVATKCVGKKEDEELSASAPLVTIPASLAIEVTNARPPTPFPKFMSQSFWENCLWDQRLAAMLLFEKKVLGRDSERLQWIQQLPSSYSTPYAWNDKLLDDELQYASLAQRVRRQRKDWREFFAKWQTAAKDSTGDQFLQSGLKLDDVVWALQTVNSRAFSGAYEGSSADQRQQLLLFTGALTLIWPLAGLGTWEQSLSAAVAVALSIFLRDLLTSSSLGNSKLKRYVICPFIDMFNHRSGCVSDVSYNYFANQFELRTEQYQEGSQVFLSYGRQSNDRLLQYYGFVDAGNCHDVYDFNTNIIELLLARADEMEDQGSLPIPSNANLSPEQRLQAIAAALQRTEVTDATYLGTRRVTNTRGDRVPVRLYREPPQSLFADDEDGVLDNEGEGEGAPDAPIRGQGQMETTPGIIGRFDDVTVRALRALYATEAEWASFGDLRNAQALGRSLSSETEECIAAALRAFCRLELRDKPTTLAEDQALLLVHSERKAGAGKGLNAGMAKGKDVTVSDGAADTGRGFAASKQRKGQRAGAGDEAVEMDPSGLYRDALVGALAFRIEKKKLLCDAALVPS